MGRFFAVLCVIAVLGQPVRAAEPGRGSSQEKSPWLWLLPGGGQFMLGQNARGTTYAAGTLSLLGWGAYAETRREPGELNAPLIYTQQLYVCSLYEAYRDVRLAAESRFPGGRIGRERYSVPVDPSSIEKLTAAPFSFEQLKSPWVIASAALGAGINLAWIKLDPDRRNFGSVRHIEYLGDRFNRDWGSAVYSAYWIPISIGAGVSEETLFRGMIQADVERRWGPRAGLYTASSLFGLAHLRRFDDPDNWALVGLAGLGGLFFGWRYQRTGYRLAEPVAAHVWFDIAAGLTLFFADPHENPLGAQVRYAF